MNKSALWLLRIGLASVFLYAAVGSLFQPDQWIGYLPAFASKLASPLVLIKILAVYELVLATWLLSGVRGRYAGFLSALTLAGIFFTNLNQLPITFRDFGLICAALALGLADR